MFKINAQIFLTTNNTDIHNKVSFCKLLGSYRLISEKPSKLVNNYNKKKKN